MINYIEHHIVDHCNLNCAGCSHFSPLAPQWFEDINDFKKDFNQLAQLTDVRTIRIMGGEPLLHPNFELFCAAARDFFPNSDIWIVTNGILLQKLDIKEKALHACNTSKIGICVSNYSLNLNLEELLEGFKYRVIHWKNQMYNVGLSLMDLEKEQENFNSCDLHLNQWYYFQFGRLFPCCVSANIRHLAQHFNITDLNIPIEKSSISIYDHSINEIQNFLNNPILLCKHCNTFYRMHNHHQFTISKKELSEWTYQ